MDELEAGKQKFYELLKGLDASTQAVVPTTPSNSVFLISLTKGGNRKFITVHEDDMIELPNDAAAVEKVTKLVKDAIAGL